MSEPRQINEAELQTQLVARVRAALPLLPATIKVEHYLNLRLGRRAMTIDGKELEKGTVQGRYDILVALDITPLILAELKAPDVDLTDDDVGQALSYARVHQPLVPLVLVTNGKEIRLLRTYDGKDLSPDDMEGARLKTVLEGAAALGSLGDRRCDKDAPRDVRPSLGAAVRCVEPRVDLSHDGRCPGVLSPSRPRACNPPSHG